MEPFVFRVQNPKVIQLPEVIDAINTGLAPLLLGGLDAASCWREIGEWCDPRMPTQGAVFLGYEDAKLLALLLLEPPPSPFDPYPHIVYFQNLGSKKLLAEMRRQLIAHCGQFGHKVVSLHNGTKTADSVYVRGMLGRGATAEIGGSRILWLVGDEGTIRGQREQERSD